MLLLLLLRYRKARCRKKHIQHEHPLPYVPRRERESKREEGEERWMKMERGRVDVRACVR